MWKLVKQEMWGIGGGERYQIVSVEGDKVFAEYNDWDDAQSTLHNMNYAYNLGKSDGILSIRKQFKQLLGIS